MLLNPAQITIGHLRLLSQLERLQDFGHLPGTTVNFGNELENTLTGAYRGLTGVDPSGALPPAARFWSQSDYQSRILRILQQSIRFRPHVAPDFRPLQGILTRGVLETPFPVIIEKVGCRQAADIIRDRTARRYVEEFSIFDGHDEIKPMVFLMRGWEGEVHAMAVVLLHPEAGTKTMYCSKDIKFDRNDRTAFRGVGPLLVLARLIYMKNAGYWTDEAPVLRDIFPKVLHSYRSRFLLRPRSSFSRGEGQIERAEAQYMISHSPFDLVELPPLPRLS